jgi:hypothetical protein
MLDRRTMNNAGTAIWSSSGPFYFRNGGTLNNSGLFEVRNTLYMGDNGGMINNTGTLRKMAGSNFTGANTIPVNNVSPGVIEVNSGNMTLYQFTNSGGTVNLNGGTFVCYVPVNLQGGTLKGTGTVSGQIINSGIVAPGSSAGIITGTTGYTQYTTGTLNIELGGLTPGTQYDQLKVTGAASLAGTLNVSLINGYIPNVGDSFTIMTHGSRTGNFGTVNFNCTSRTWSITYNPTSVTITVTGIGEACVPTPTPTLAPPTATPGPPTATPTPCTGFSDVQPGSTFYPYVICLVNRGIIGGYPDCTFRPNVNVTRGQLSKIVSLAANLTDPPGAQLFQDVAPGSTFYDFIQRLANRGIIGGYACGGASEPCVPPLNRPYFRQNNNATRGQISKIVSNAAGFNDPPGTQIFQDIAPGSTFYDFIQRLANRGVMSGYACGGASEPCVPPLNRPYFRQNNNATRGQISKIVANTFFPGCQAMGGK